MAVIQCERKRMFNAVLNGAYESEAIQVTFWLYLNSDTIDVPSMYVEAQNPAFTNPLPARWEHMPENPNYDLYATAFQFRNLDEHKRIVECQVTYSEIPPFGFQRTDNPLDWPVEFSISWLEEEYVVERGWNKEALGRSTNKRDPDTYGPIVNGAMQEFDQPLMDTIRHPVVAVKYNASGVNGLSQVVAINSTYQLTTNSDTFLGAAAYQCKFVGCETSGRQRLNGVDYYPITISVLIKSTTDVTLNNIGWNALGTDGKLVCAKVKDPDTGEQVRPSEPVFLAHDGSRAPSGETPVVTYRYLKPVLYYPILNKGAKPT